MFVSKAMFFFVGQQFSEVALLLMKLINGVLKEGRYKKKGRTLDKIWRDSNWGENRYPGPAEPGKGKVAQCIITFWKSKSV